MSDDDVTVVDGLPVTTVVRTAADLAASFLDSDHLAGVLSAAVENLDVDVEELAQALSPYATRYGFDSGRAPLAEVAPGYVAAALGRAVRMVAARSPRLRKQALKLLAKPDGMKTLVTFLEERLAS
ncbi:hypothetical protein [Herbiconiux sp. UC225_62]|uniref:hypothetical protein n=1 Tax=Herbiconiux sp. UC225_62 TaxID=3350168 RepID=UPI0036D2FE70